MENNAWIFLLLLQVESILAVPNHFHIAIDVNTTWVDLCPSMDIFRNGLSHLIKQDYNNIVFANEKEMCADKKQNAEQVTLLYYFAITKGAKGATLDIKATLAAEKKLYKGALIGRYTILSFTMKNTSGVQKVIYSTRTILIVIGIVLLVYLIGHLLILSMKSYSTRADSKERPLSFILAAENVYFTTEDGPLSSKKADKHRLISTSRKSVLSKTKGYVVNTTHK